MKETEVIKTLLDDESLDSIKVSIIKAIAKHIVKRYDGRVTRVLNEKNNGIIINKYLKSKGGGWV
jgi:ribosomal protein S17E